MNILETITEKTKQRIEEEKKRLPLLELRRQAEAIRHAELAAPAGAESAVPRFEAALAQEGLSFLCEVKRASPSKGLIAPDFPYLEIAADYEAAGASAISCLTEPYWFQGSDQILEEIAARTPLPILRKDFTCDEYMIYQAKAMGASAILLICSVLDDGSLRSFHQLADELGLSVLVEAHDASEIQRARAAGARIIGVNNRNLKDFTVDLENSRRLRELAGPEVLFVSESGVSGPEDLGPLCANGTDAVLIGEYLMRAPDRQDALRGLREAAQKAAGTGDRKGANP